jgi:hypothetical protein
MIYKYPKNLSYKNYISEKIQFHNQNDYNKVVSNQNIKKDEILIIESSQFNLFGFDLDFRELNILKKYIENKNNPDIINLYPRNYNYVKTDLIKSVHKIIKSIRNSDKNLYNFLIDFSKEELELYFAKYIFNGFEGYEYGPLTLPNIAKLNHSCNPNVRFNFNKNDGCMYVKSIRNIKKGEEIFDSYLENKQITNHKIYLKEHYGFVCECI